MVRVSKWWCLMMVDKMCFQKDCSDIRLTFKRYNFRLSFRPWHFCYTCLYTNSRIVWTLFYSLLLLIFNKRFLTLLWHLRLVFYRFALRERLNSPCSCQWTDDLSAVLHCNAFTCNLRRFHAQVNSALHPSGVAKSSTSFGWGKGGKSPLPGGR